MLSYLHKSMLITGIWPNKNLPVYIRYIIAGINILLSIYILLGCCLHLREILKDRISTTYDIIDGILTIVGLTNLTYNYIVCVFNWKISQSLFNNLQYFDDYGVPKNLNKIHLKVDKLCIIIFGYSLVGGVMIEMNGIISYEKCIEDNHKTGRDVTCGFGLSVYYPYNFTKDFSYIFHIIINFYCASVIPASGSLFVCALISAAEYIIVRIDHLDEMILEIFNVGDNKEQELKIKRCIGYHIRIIKLVEQINSGFSIITTPGLCTYSIIIGLSVFAIMEEVSGPKPAITALGFLFCTFICTLYGQNLIEKSDTVINAGYNSKWYDGEVFLQKDLLFMIMRAQKPFTINVGPFGYFHFPFFTQVMRGAYTYISLKPNT